MEGVSRMKQLLKRTVKKAWQLTAAVRRPIARRIDARLHRIVVQALQTSQQMNEASSGAASARRDQPHHDQTHHAFMRVEHSLGAMHEKVDRYSTEVDLVLNSLVREISRLQIQVETLQDALDDARTRRPLGLSVVDDSGPETQRRSRVG